MGQAGSRLLNALRYVALTLTAAIGVAFVTGLGGPSGWLIAIVAGGALAAATASGLVASTAVGGAAGLLGGLVASRAYRAPMAIQLLVKWKVGYPPSQVHDEFIGPLMKSSAVNGSWGRGDIGLLVALAIGTAGVAALCHWLLSSASSRQRTTMRAVLGGVAVAAVSLALVLGAWSGPFRLRSTHELPVGGYAYDSGIYMNAYFNLLHGVPYYPALVKAAAGDSRLIATRSVHDGKFYAWAYSASFIRMPWTFYIWRLLAPTGGLWYVSLALCVLALFAVYWGLYPSLGTRAALVPPILFPLLLMCTGWMNMYFPDWWAALAILFSVMFRIRKRYLVAALLALLAGIFRDVALIWLTILIAHALYRALRGDKEWWPRFATYVLLIAGFFALYIAHLKAGAPYVAPQPSAPDVKGRLAAAAAMSFSQRFIAPSAYMMIPYGQTIGKRAVMLFAQLPGWYLVLRRNTAALVPVLAFAVFWIVFTATIGATSSYWGQMYTPIAVVGSAALLAWVAPEVDTV